MTDYYNRNEEEYMNPKENILSLFRGDQPDQIVWQPRIENWYNVNHAHGTLPPKYSGKSLMEVYDELGCSPRPYLIPYPSPEDLRSEATDKWKGFAPQDVPPVIKADLDSTLDGEIEVTGTGSRGDKIIERWYTPKGNLTRKWMISEDSISQRVSEYPIKSLEDLDILEYILTHQEWEFDYDAYREAEKQIGDRAAIAAISPRAPFIQYIMFYLNYEDAIILLHKHRDRIESFLELAEEADRKAFEVIKDSPVDVVCLPTNLDGQLVSPPLFEEFILPHYLEYGSILKEAGKYVYAHWDGRVKPLLPFARQTGLHGIEALTPVPQGDMTIEEIDEALGDEMILLDGVPANYFLPYQYDEELLIRETKRILDNLSPNIILGISDEIPADGDINRVKIVSEIVEQYNSVNSRE